MRENGAEHPRFENDRSENHKSENDRSENHKAKIRIRTSRVRNPQGKKDTMETG